VRFVIRGGGAPPLRPAAARTGAPRRAVALHP
jgi:hypothetical protein